MIRKWFSVKEQKPEDGQKVYYFCDFLGIFRGEYHYLKSKYSSPHKFSSHHGILDSDEVSHWMPYDHALKDIIPLPPDYKKTPITNIQSMLNSGEEISIPEDSRQLEFTYSITGELDEQIR